jgi:D-alanyl-D-alanine carboxypeptidase/D-alanyl-D-alanine-endopeptidase (penicillin-binding protein 4)
MKSGAFSCCLTLIVSAALQGAGGTAYAQNNDGAAVSKDIKMIMDKPGYKGATWGLRVIDLDNGHELVNLNPGHQFFIASVRKNFSVGELMDKVGPGHRYNTPVYRQGKVNQGVLDGDLIIVASGDLTMGGRTNPDGTVAYTVFDHNEANELGNAVLSKPDPLAGYKALARQVAASGITEIKGDVVIDDRLFKPYEFREEFDMRPIFVNDDTVDLIINPEQQGNLASVQHRPVSEALRVKNEVEMTASNSQETIKPQLPTCIGEPGCSVTLQGNLPVGFMPPLTGTYPLIRTYRITKPSDYARTVFIEALRAAGVTVKAPAVEPNPTQLLPGKDWYKAQARVAELEGLPYSEDAKLVMKVSYNLGADTSLLLWGLTEGVDSMDSALVVEKRNLSENFGIPQSEYTFFDGSGGDDTTATNEAVTHFLDEMSKRSVFPDYLASFPILGVDGSLGTVTDFEEDATLAPAKGNVFAKTGTYVGAGGPTGVQLKAQAFGGYITTKCGKKLAYQLVVNGVTIVNPDEAIGQIVNVFQDEGRISAILWRDF